MIVFVIRSGPGDRLAALRAPDAGIEVRPMDYRKLLGSSQLPRATYIFTDLDRIPLFWLRLAAQVWRQLRDRGQHVLNDPARVLSRYGLLRRLHAAGFNRFNAYRAEDTGLPARWPVFLHCQGDPLGRASGLIHSPEALRRTVDRAVAAGLPIASLLIIEHAAEETRPGLYRRYGCFRVGPARFAHLCVDASDWAAQESRPGLTPPDLEAEERRILRDDPWGPALAPAFDIAGIDYGRADFGLVGGRPQLYEIDTNPEIVFADATPAARRQPSYDLFRASYLSALRAIDTPAG
jgi:hypothetical protein